MTCEYLNVESLLVSCGRTVSLKLRNSRSESANCSNTTWLLWSERSLLETNLSRMERASDLSLLVVPSSASDCLVSLGPACARPATRAKPRTWMNLMIECC